MNEQELQIGTLDERDGTWAEETERDPVVGRERQEVGGALADNAQLTALFYALRSEIRALLEARNDRGTAATTLEGQAKEARRGAQESLNQAGIDSGVSKAAREIVSEHVEVVDMETEAAVQKLGDAIYRALLSAIVDELGETEDKARAANTDADIVDAIAA